MNSCLYQGVLRHRRLQPKAHHFRYRIFMAWLDLDELDRLGGRVVMHREIHALGVIHESVSHGGRHGPVGMPDVILVIPDEVFNSVQFTHGETW